MKTIAVGVLSTLAFVVCDDLFLNFCPESSGPEDRTTQRSICNFGYPKCCPPQSRYNPKQHNCLETTRFPFKQPKGIAVVTSLSKCTNKHVIVDYSNIEVSLENNHTLVINGSFKTSYGSYCFDRGYPNGESVVRVCRSAEEVCRLSFEGSGMLCLRKCCPDGQSFYNGNVCENTYSSGISLNDSLRFKNIHDATFAVIQCDLPPIYMAQDEHEFYLNNWGELHIKENYYWHSYPSTKAKYCIETVHTDNISGQHFFLYEKDEFKDIMSLVHIQSVGLVLSIVFLVLTVFIHLLLPKMRNLHGKCVIMYCINSTLFALCILLYPNNYDTTVYIVRCFIILFLVNGLFAWLSVLSFDIWKTFRSDLSVKGRQENVKFVFYNLFGWGLPAFWTVFVAIIYTSDCLPPSLKQSLHSANRNGCFFRIRTDRFGYIFYVVPFLISTSANIVFLALAVTKWCNTKNEISRLKECSVKEYNQNKKSLFRTWDRLTTTSKLLFMTGVLRLGDIISLEIDSTSDPIMFYLRAIWIVVGSSSGFFIFAIYVLKVKVLVSLNKRVKFIAQRIGNDSQQSLDR